MLYHGAHSGFAPHLGQCWTDDEESAEVYAGRNGVVAECEIALDGLRVVEVEGYDRDSDEAPGDRELVEGADILVYDDEDERGRPHRTWRIQSEAALAAVTILRTGSELCTCEECDGTGVDEDGDECGECDGEGQC